MTHCDPSVVSSRDERWGNQCGRLLGQSRGVLAVPWHLPGQRGAKERKTGQSYLGHNTMNNQGKTSPEYSMEVSQWCSPEREALHSTRLTAAPTQKGVPVPTSCINQPEGRSMRISSDRFHWGKHQSLHIAEQWTSGFANVARILPSARQEETAGSTTRAEGSSAVKLYTLPHSPR